MAAKRGGDLRLVHQATPSDEDRAAAAFKAALEAALLPQSSQPRKMTREERAALVDRVVLECSRDPMFAQLLANNLQAAGVRLPASEDAGGRKQDWSAVQLMHLLMEFALLRREGLTAAGADERIADSMGRGMTAKHIANMRTKARKVVDPEDFGPELRAIVFPENR